MPSFPSSGVQTALAGASRRDTAQARAAAAGMAEVDGP